MFVCQAQKPLSFANAKVIKTRGLLTVGWLGSAGSLGKPGVTTGEVIGKSPLTWTGSNCKPVPHGIPRKWWLLMLIRGFGTSNPNTHGVDVGVSHSWISLWFSHLRFLAASMAETQKISRWRKVNEVTGCACVTTMDKSSTSLTATFSWKQWWKKTYPTSDDD